MSRFFSNKYDALTAYTPGEQPQDRKYIKLNTNESPFPPSPLAQRLARMEAGDLQLYSDPECRKLAETAAYIFGIDREEILFGNGSDDVLNYAFMAFCDEDHPAAFPNITYGFYKVFAALNRVPFLEKPLKEDFSINTDDYTAAGCTIFISNPNANTGIALPLSDIEKIVASNPDNVVVIDEAYADFGTESALPLIHRYDNLLVVQTMSKSRSLAGARLGWAAGCRELIRDLNTIKYSTNPYNINRMSMNAGIGALIDREYFESNCRQIIANREQTVSELKRLGFIMTDSRANFLLARHPDIGGSDLYLKLKERGILVRHFSTELLNDYIRITIGSMEQMTAFISVLENILEECK